MSEIDNAADEWRLAILVIELHMLNKMAPGAIASHDEPRWDGDVWVQPETRFDIGKLLAEWCVPKSWHIARRPFVPGVYIDPMAGRLCILFASESFPVVNLGTMPPYVTPILQWVHAEDRSERVFVGWDMHEVMERSDAS